jgi:hypothetical protein
MASDRSSTLVFVFILFALLLTYPIMSIVDESKLVWGMPMQFFYFFLIWMALIVVVALVVRKRKN